jgi:hypothetical protein
MVLDFSLKGKSEVAYSTEHIKWVDGKEKGETVKDLPCKRASGNHVTFNIYLFIYVGKTLPHTTHQLQPTDRAFFILLRICRSVSGRRWPFSHKDTILFNILQDLVENTHRWKCC